MGKKRKYNKRIDYTNISLASANMSSYVYFSSILKEPKNSPQYQLGIQAQAQLSSIGNQLIHNSNNGENQTEGKIINALNFLKQAAEFERIKELQFFQNYRSQYSNVIDSLKFDSISADNLDYQQFIVDINIALKGMSSFKNEINTELDRISRLRDADQEAYKHYKDTKTMTDEQKQQYLEDIRRNMRTAGGTKVDAGTNEGFYLKRASDITLRQGLLENGTLNSEITDLIINKYGSTLFAFQDGKLKLKPSLISFLIKVINDRVYSELINQYQDIRQNNTTSTRLKTIIENKEIQEFINNLIENDSLRTSLESIAAQHNIDDQTLQKATINENEIHIITNKIKTWYNSTHNSNAPTFETWLQNHKEFDITEMIRTANAAKSQLYYTGEDMSLMGLIAAGFSGILGGNENPTDDWEAGYLVINTDIDKRKIDNIVTRERQNLAKLQNQYFEEITKTTDLASFINNTNRLRELREKKAAILKELKIKLDKSELAGQYLLQHINIHGTVKGYQSAGRDSFEYYGGFEGAAFGSNLNNQLDILTSSAGTKILGSQGISEEDKKWLHFAMINAGAQMLGAQLKPTIENYFSIFVGFFMFNDAALMIEDAATFMENQYQIGSQDLHMYQLNGVLVPASYLLQQTYESLLPLTTNIQAEINTSQSTRAVLHTYNNSPGSRNWAAVAAEAESATYLEMKFLSGFLALLKSIAEKVNEY